MQARLGDLWKKSQSDPPIQHDENNKLPSVIGNPTSSGKGFRHRESRSAASLHRNIKSDAEVLDLISSEDESHGASPSSAIETRNGTMYQQQGQHGLREIFDRPLNFNVMFHEFMCDRTPDSDRSGEYVASSPLSVLASGLEQLEATRSRLSKENILTNMFRLLLVQSPRDFSPTARILTNSLGPAWGGESLGVGNSTVSQAVQAATGLTRTAIRKLYAKLGDLGSIASEAKQRQSLLFQHRSLSIADLWDSMQSISKRAGAGSGTARLAACTLLLRRCSSIEIKYVTRALLQHLRVGATVITVLQCAARASVIHRYQSKSDMDPAVAVAPGDCARSYESSHSSSSRLKETARGGQTSDSQGIGTREGRQYVLLDRSRPITGTEVNGLNGSIRDAIEATRRAYGKCPVLEIVLHTLLSSGYEHLESACSAQIGIPIQPMLAAVATAPSDVIKRKARHRMQAELKYDGQRVQIHIKVSSSAFVQLHSRYSTPSSSRARLDAWPPMSSVTFTELEGQSVACVSVGGIDGIMVHVRCYSRHLENTTTRWPQIADRVARSILRLHLPFADWKDQHDSFPHSLIVDGEIIAVQHTNRMASAPVAGSKDEAVLVRTTGAEADLQISEYDDFTATSCEDLETLMHAQSMQYRILPFQQLSRRPDSGGAATETRGGSQKQGASAVASTALILYDVMLIDGQDICHIVLQSRRERLARLLPVIPGELELSCRLVCDEDPDAMAIQVKRAVKCAVANGCEGVMCKVLSHSMVDSRLSPDVGSSATTRREDSSKDGNTAIRLTGSKRGRTQTTPSRQTCESNLSASYNSIRSDSWLKLKKDYIEGMADSFDLVPIAAWMGNGRKAGWLSPILMATRDPDTGEFSSVCRVMSGLTDDIYKRLTAWYLEPGKGRYYGVNSAASQGTMAKEDGASCSAGGSGSMTGEQVDSGDCSDGVTGMISMLLPEILPAIPLDRHPCPAQYSTGESPLVWLKPLQVWEVRGADLTASAVHLAASGMVGQGDRGVSIRFPRFIRVRDDKAVEDCTPPVDIARSYLAQGSSSTVGRDPNSSPGSQTHSDMASGGGTLQETSSKRSRT